MLLYGCLQVHTDDQISVPLEAALQSGKLDVSKIMATAKSANCIQEEKNATFHISTSTSSYPSRAEETEITIGSYSTSIEKGTCVWKLTGQVCLCACCVLYCPPMPCACLPAAVLTICALPALAGRVPQVPTLPRGGRRGRGGGHEAPAGGYQGCAARADGAGVPAGQDRADENVRWAQQHCRAQVL